MGQIPRSIERISSDVMNRICGVFW